MFDLDSLDTVKACDRGAALELRHPETRKPLGVKITLAGADSEKYMKAANKIAANRANMALTPAKMKRTQQGLPIEVTPEELEDRRDDALRLLAAATLSWEGVVVSGQEIACSEEEAFKLYRKFPWIKDQVDAFVSDRANFLTGSPEG